MSSKHFLKLLGSTPRSQTSVIGRQPDLLSRIVGSQAVHGGPPFAQKKSIHSWCNTEPTFLITNPLQITQTQHFHPSPRSLRSSPSSTENKLYEFDDVLHILEHPSDSRLLIDVREPHEYDANNIPTAINIPVTSHPDALLLPEEEFGEQFGFEKPPRGKEVVFFCKAGVRSRAAAGIARQAG
ncbi:Rhodanese-like protein [Pyrenophora tritici-repentis]